MQGQNLISSLSSDTSITIGQYMCQSIVLAEMVSGNKFTTSYLYIFIYTCSWLYLLTDYLSLQSMTCDLSTGSIENGMTLYANVS